MDVLKLIEDNRNDFFGYLNKVAAYENKLLVKGNLFDILDHHKSENKNGSYKALAEIAKHIVESVCINNTIFFEFREKIGDSFFYLFNTEEKYYEQSSVTEYLRAKEYHVDGQNVEDPLTLNFNHFYFKFPRTTESKNIGRGVEYLNRYLSSRMFTEPEKLSKILFDFLFLHKYKSQQLVLNDRIKDPSMLSSAIDKAIAFLRKKDENTPYSKIKNDLQSLGFEAGLGNNAATIIESLELLDRLMQTPDHNSLKDFLSRIPMIFNIAIISPHGYFGQEGVLGMPDTGGQVVYILDQVKALEKSMSESLQKSGLNAKPKIIILTRLIPNAGKTKCNQRMEKVHETNNSWILRVPFRTHNSNVTDNWISRFEIWPYLENFAEDSERELLAEFNGRPDFIIGNYSDGNLVGYILSKKFGVTQCNIAHALEKSKYLYSALYWKNLEDQYHFSLQFTADLIAMNSANFIITSSYQEIAGTEETIGQYESYRNLTMPGLYRVEGGIELFHPKFNIVPPGVNTKIYFPYYETGERLKDTKEELEKLLFSQDESDEVVGKLENPELIPIFSIARLDKIKNLTSLVKWFGESQKLQKAANLIIVAGNVDPMKSGDEEEKEQIYLMHDLINKYNLRNKFRWIGKRFKKDETGEVYRIIADHKGIFVQPALFEGFGLTVLEAMRSGLPVFATLYGGPLEIIQDEVSGFHINPIKGKETTAKILSFIEKCNKDKKYWEKISAKAIKRVDTTYNWELYSNNLLSLAKIYGFWKFASNIEQNDLHSYLNVIYHLLYKPRANELLQQHANR
ncbi:MAG: sucrose synthase [Ignavibacteriales bacterium]|nr:MAG: sucrose synthase [Ignavibacteriales bacterium]